MGIKNDQRFLPEAVAIGTAVIALLLTLWLEPFLSQSVTVFFTVAITISTWYGGLKPGLVGVVFSTLAINSFFIPPVEPWTDIILSDGIRFATFCLLAVVIHLLSRNLKNSKRQIEQLSRQLLENKSQQLQMVLSAAQMGMWDWNIKTGEINWSPEHEQLFGLKIGSFDGKYQTFEACVHPEDRDELNQTVQRALKEQVPYQHDYRVIWADGSIHWIEARGQAFYNQAGEAVQLTGTIMAIDDRKKAQAKLEEREAILRLFVQYAPAGIAMFDREMRYLMASQRWAEEYHLDSIESLIGRSHYEIFPEIPEHWRQVHQRCLAGAIEKCDEDLFVRSDGTEQWISWEIHPWYKATGKIGGIILFSIDITKRKRAEIALQQTQTQIQRQLAEIETIYHSAPIGLNVLDTELRFVRINQRLAEINGFSIEAHIGRTVRELLPDLADDAEELLRAILETGEALLNVEITGETPAQPGVQRTWLESFLPLKNGDRIIGISTVCEEITQRKQAQLTLQQLNAELEERIAERTAQLRELNHSLLETVIEQQYTQLILWEQSQLLDLAHDGIITCDLNNIITFWNSGAESMYGWTKAEALGQETHILLNTRFPKPLAEIQSELLKLGYWEGELIHIRKDGSAITVASRWVMQKDQTGKPIKVLKMNNDITRQKQIEEQLRQSEAKFRSLSECSPIGIFMMDIRGGCIYSNPRCQAICGYTFDEAIASGWLEFVHPEDREQVLSNCLKAVSQKREFSDEIRYVHRDETIRFARMQSVPIFSGADELMGYVGTVEDVTESRAIEKIKREFLSIVSHELRTPLTSIRGSLGLLAAGVFKNKPETAQQMLDIASHDTERLVRLVNDILDLERLDSQKVNLVKHWCDGETLLQQSVKTMEALALENHMILRVESASVEVFADRDRIIQTLVNLVSNAIKFSPPESTVTLSVQDQADRVLFQVQDQGRGIPAEKIDTIFGRFQQVDASDSREKGGTGLGLAICKSIVQQHGGSIWVESVVGEGSCFYFTLPKPLD